jgi:predicted Rdx family selenoprotein
MSDIVLAELELACIAGANWMRRRGTATDEEMRAFARELARVAIDSARERGIELRAEQRIPEIEAIFGRGRSR